MVKKEYKIVGTIVPINNFLDNLKSQNIRFGRTFILAYEHNYTDFFTSIRLNISPDMVQEVEDLIKEIAEKSGVKVE